MALAREPTDPPSGQTGAMTGTNNATGDWLGGASPSGAQTGADGRGHVVFIDLDTVLLATFEGRRGIELGIQADLLEGIGRLAEIADQIVVLVYPQGDEARSGLTAERRIEVLRDGLGRDLDQLLLITCPHGAEGCDCAKPGSGLIRLAIERNQLPDGGGWYIGADQEGVVSGRGAGLQTVRIGPLGGDHLSSVHRPDYEARDLLDAANHILLAELG
jgi:hypothetical protein